MSLLFSFFGRCGRGGFWLGVLASLIISLIFVGGAQLLFGPAIQLLDANGASLPLGSQPPEGAKMVMNAPAIALIGLGYIPALWVALATQVKRCHDRGFSGWWILLEFIPIFGFFWVLISLGIRKGQEGPNEYGPDPRAARA